jgi:hypothetical protein
VGEAYIQLILSATPEVLPPVEALLEVVAHPDAEIHSMAFPFWHKLGRQLMSSFDQAAPGALEPPDPTTAAAARSEQLRRQQFFSPAFERLLSLMRNMMRWGGGFFSGFFQANVCLYLSFLLSEYLHVLCNCYMWVWSWGSLLVGVGVGCSM